MAHQECNVGSLYNWWPHLHIANSWNQHNTYSSNSSDDVDEDVSMFTNVSNDHSGVTIESFDQSVSTNEMVGETETPIDHQPWNHLVLNGSNGDFEGNQDVGDNLVDQFSSKNFPNDYLKKMESSGWDFTNSLFFNTNNIPLNESSSSVEQTQTLNKPSNSTFNYTSIINNTSANTPFIRSHNLQTSNFSDSKKRVDQLQISYPFNRSTKGTSPIVTRRNVKAQRAPRNSTQGKKKRSSDEESSNTLVKKPMLQRPTLISSTKTQVPKVKLTDKITALQQIVSPFGKTDTASVLWEAICYVRFLQEQIQLLMSNPYMKNNSCKDPWGNINMEGSHDLRSRGLCLVPISFTPQIYGDNNGCDYFTPPYRGSLYR